MQKHVRNYLEEFGYNQFDTILCECCGAVSCDIHHVEPRSKFGSTRKIEQDAPGNLIALCRRCHDMAHGVYSEHYKFIFKDIISKR